LTGVNYFKIVWSQSYKELQKVFFQCVNSGDPHTFIDLVRYCLLSITYTQNNFICWISQWSFQLYRFFWNIPIILTASYNLQRLSQLWKNMILLQILLNEFCMRLSVRGINNLNRWMNQFTV
jgi:cellulose synthase/poly-beta-1,6-N-acetylglucosamine synthase-like glycosyltransferase